MRMFQHYGVPEYWIVDPIAKTIEMYQTNKWKEWDLVYWLGPERGPFGVDSEWLVIKFDSSGRVQDYQIVRD